MSEDRKFVFDKSGTRLEGGARIVELPVLAIRNTIVFPVLAFPINVGRSRSLKAVDAALESDKLLAVIAQHEAKVEDPNPEDLYKFGTVVKIVKTLTGQGLLEAKTLVDSPPATIQASTSKEVAEAMRAQLVEAGATVNLAPVPCP